MNYSCLSLEHSQSEKRVKVSGVICSTDPRCLFVLCGSPFVLCGLSIEHMLPQKYDHGNYPWWYSVLLAVIMCGVCNVSVPGASIWW